MNAQRGATLDSRFDDIDDQFASAQRSVVNGLWATRDQVRNGYSQYYAAMQSLAQTVLIEQLNDDVPLLSKTLAVAAAQLEERMLADLEYIRRPSTSSSVAADGSNVGDAQVLVSLVDSKGRSMDMIFAEDLTLTATNDSTRGATAFRETFTLRGEPAVAASAYDWPAGSGASQSLTAVDGAATGGLVSAGAFESGWTATNTPPTPWSIQTGTAGTTVFRGSNPARSTGTYNLRLTGTGAAENTAVEQDVTTGLGSQPLTSVAFGCWVAVDSTPAAGVLQARLVDGSNATIADEAGTDNSLTKDLTGVSTAYEFFGGYFRLPNEVPSAVKLQIRLSTAITSGRSVDVDLVAMTLASQAYDGGPFVAVFSGTTASVRDDEYVVTLTSDGAADDFCRLLDRLYGLRSLGVRIPSSGTPTVLDSLIT
jgi:hypothetical protein